MNLLRNESANDRLLALEKQMKILSSSKSCVKTGSTAVDEEKSDKPISEYAKLLRKTAKPEKKLYYHKGKNTFAVNCQLCVLWIVRI